MLHCSFLNVFFTIFFFYNVVMVYGFGLPSARIGHRHTCVPSFLNPPPPQPICPGLHRALLWGVLLQTSNFHWPCLTYGNICFSDIVSNPTTLFVFFNSFLSVIFSVHIFNLDLTFSLHSFPALL